VPILEGSGEVNGAEHGDSSDYDAGTVVIREALGFRSASGALKWLSLLKAGLFFERLP
jgi:hypothetical protein